jgi:hypothetical protein
MPQQVVRDAKQVAAKARCTDDARPSFKAGQEGVLDQIGTCRFADLVVKKARQRVVVALEEQLT